MTTQQTRASRIAEYRSKISESEAQFTTDTVGNFVRDSCARFADRVAFHIIETGQEVTYAELDRESDRIARGLISLGLHKGDRIGVMLPNCRTFPLLWVAIAKVGAVLVPVNTRYTPREIEYVLSDSGAKFAVVDAAFLATFALMENWPENLDRKRLLVTGTDRPEVGRSFDLHIASSAADPVSSPEVTPDTLMNIQYTSGTTGFPKGCMLTHDYWMVFAFQGARWEPAPLERYFTAQPFFYVDPQWLFLKCIRNGGTLFIAPQLSSSRFMGWLKKYSIQWCHVPELVGRQPAEADDSLLMLEDVPGFGWGRETSQHFKSRFPCVRTGDGFAMTEIAFGTQRPFEFEDMFDSGSVGIAAPFRSIRVVKEDGTDASDGETGEAWVKGRSIFKGYWNRPEANAEVFQGEWFRTGDLFRVDGNGFFWLVGRVKEMIRRSNENIAAREVESVIREIAEVEDVAAVPVKDVMRGEEVKVYIQLKDGLSAGALSVDRVMEHSRKRLAAFKVPRFIQFVDGFPRTVSNKIKKNELVASYSDQTLGSYDAQDGVWR